MGMDLMCMECMVGECDFATRESYSFAVSLEYIDRHLRDQHNTTFKQEWSDKQEKIEKTVRDEITDDNAAEKIFEAFNAYAEDS